PWATQYEARLELAVPQGGAAHVAFERIKTLGPAISDLSWLNPTPHAIAVYASHPLSPVATQHSLPSGRYSLLGPDLRRLDRTSFAAGALIRSPHQQARGRTLAR